MKEKDTYELWFLGDHYNSRVKSRESFDKLLIEAGELMRCGREAGLTVGGVEICRVSAVPESLHPDVETVWDFNFADNSVTHIHK
jgi:hypothetical protein